MKNLVIHPKDPITSSLSPIYAPLKNKTVINGGVTKSQLRKLIETHDRIIMFGHGSLHGLLSVGQFPDAEFCIIDGSMANVLTKKTEFANKDEEYARDIWLFLYRCNGINFADLFRMKWDNIHGNNFIFFRKITEKTRKNDKKQIVARITPKFQQLIDKIGVKDSPLILGLLEEGYQENTFVNLSDKMRKKINGNLEEISKRLNLSVPLKTDTARDCYASTLRRAKVSKDDISDLLGHSNSIVTEHYLDSLISKETLSVNEVLF